MPPTLSQNPSGAQTQRGPPAGLASVGDHLPALPKDLRGWGKEMMTERRAGCSAETSAGTGPQTPSPHAPHVPPSRTSSCSQLF